MRITKHEFLHQLTFMPVLFPVNCYFVEEENELTLIDTGLASHASKIVDAARKIGKPITKIVLTHAHGDHVGGLDGVKAAFPKADVYLSKRDFRLFENDFSLDSNEPQNSIRGGVPKGIQTKPNILLEDGDQIGSLLAVSSPGHTPGSMSFLDKRNNSLIAGDAFQVRGGFAVAGLMRWSFPFPALATWSRKLAIESAEKLLDLEPSLLAVGHGDMIKSPVELMFATIEEARNLEERS